MNSREIFIGIVLPHFCICGNEDCLLISPDILSNDGNNKRRCSKWKSDIGFFIIGHGDCIYCDSPFLSHINPGINVCDANSEWLDPNIEFKMCEKIINKIPELKQYYKADMGALARISVS